MTTVQAPQSTWMQVFLAWFSMALAIISGASIGPVFKYMENNHIYPCLAASWRCQCMSIFLIPLAIVEYYRNKKKGEVVEWFSRKPGLIFPVWGHILLAGIGWSLNLLLWIVGLQYTTTVRAAILSSCHPLMMVVFFQVFGTQVVSKFEWLGVVISFSGIVLATSNSLFDKQAVEGTDSSQWNELFGDFLCLVAAAAQVQVILNRIETKKHVPLMQYTASTTLLVAIAASITSLLIEGRGEGGVGCFCFEDHCVFGWATIRWADKMLLFGLIIGVVCMTGYNYAVQYISPLVFSTISLIDPAATGLLSYLSGIEGIPDLPTILGGVVVIGGVLLITLGEHSRSETEADGKQQKQVSDDAFADDDVTSDAETDIESVSGSNFTIECDDEEDDADNNISEKVNINKSSSSTASDTQSSWFAAFYNKYISSNDNSSGSGSNGVFSVEAISHSSKQRYAPVNTIEMTAQQP